jgi:uncharacterized protein (TIGR00369 family)
MTPEQFRTLLREHFMSAIPHAQECGMSIVRLDEAAAVAQMPYRPEWLGDTERGVIHTGIVTTLADTISGMAAVMAAGRFEVVATLDLRMDFLRPALPGLTLVSLAECYRLTRSIAFVRGYTWQDNEKEPVATHQAAFMRGGAGRMVAR